MSTMKIECETSIKNIVVVEFGNEFPIIVRRTNNCTEMIVICVYVTIQQMFTLFELDNNVIDIVVNVTDDAIVCSVYKRNDDAIESIEFRKIEFGQEVIY